MKLASLLIIILSICLPVACLSGCVTIREPVVQKYSETIYISENRSESFTDVFPVSKMIYADMPLSPYILWSNPDFRFKGQKYMWYYGYDLSWLPANSSSRLKILLFEQKYYEKTTVRVFDMTPRGQIPSPPQLSPTDPVDPPTIPWNWITTEGATESTAKWFNVSNIKLNFARFLGGRENLWSNSRPEHELEIDTRGARDVAIIITGPTIPQNVRFTVLINCTQTITENRTMEQIIPYQREIKVEKERTSYRDRQAPFWELWLK